MANSFGRLGWLKVFALALAVAIPGAIAISYGIAWYETPKTAPGVDPPPDERFMSTPQIWPGLRTPATVPADRADLADAEAVVGISAGGKHRAYRIGAMRADPVINDLIGEVPVTVTYDERTDNVRVLTAEKRERPLDVDMGGLFHGNTVLRYEGKFFRQSSGRYLAGPGTEGEEALPALPHARIDWKTWRTTNPDTDVYVGRSD
jgi:hypothetical protein